MTTPKIDTLTVLSENTFKSMVQSYLETALWASNKVSEDGSDMGPLDDFYLPYQFTFEAMFQAEKDLLDFLDCTQGMFQEDSDFNQIATDFWLSRNGHGAGFFDGRYGDVGDVLQEIAENFGSLYVDETGKDELCFVG